MLLAAVCLLAFGHAGLQAQARSGNRGESRIFPPEKLGELEGPDRDLWQKPDQVMDALGIADGTIVADLGAGGGWFTVRLARRVGPQGVVYAEDIQEQMLESIDRRVKREGLRNVRMVLGASDDPKLPAQTPARRADRRRLSRGDAAGRIPAQREGRPHPARPPRHRRIQT